MERKERRYGSLTVKIEETSGDASAFGGGNESNKEFLETVNKALDIEKEKPRRTLEICLSIISALCAGYCSTQAFEADVEIKFKSIGTIAGSGFVAFIALAFWLAEKGDTKIKLIKKGK